MKTSLVRAALAAGLLGSAAIILSAVPAQVSAATRPSGPVVSVPVGKILEDARKMMEAGDFANAKLKILEAQLLPDKTPLDDYEINNYLGNVTIKLNDHPTADTAFEAMAESPAMPEDDRASTLRVASLLATEAKHYAKGIKYGMAFLALGGPADDLVLTTIAEAYYYSNDYLNAEAYGHKAVAAAAAGSSPRRGALEVVFGSQLKQNKQNDAINTLEQIVTYYDDADEWGQFIDVALGTKGIKDLDALNLYRLRLASKATAAADDFSVMAALALSVGYPVEAQAALDAGLSSGKLSSGGKIAAQLAEARGRAAKDRASLASFEALAAKSATGELDVKLAETYFGYGRYADAVAAAQSGLGKGGAKTDPNEANMVMGMSLAMQGKNADALAAFNNVKGGSAAMMRAQHLWSVFAGRKYAVAAAAPH